MSFPKFSDYLVFAGMLRPEWVVVRNVLGRKFGQRKAAETSFVGMRLRAGSRLHDSAQMYKIGRPFKE